MHGLEACSQKAIIIQVIGLINMGKIAVMKIIVSASPWDQWSTELILESIWACKAIPNSLHSLYESLSSVTVNRASLSGD